KEGIRVSLVNSNPATIMTDPEYADRPYCEPLRPEVLEATLERERPDAVLPTVGGQTALNLAMELSHRGVLDRLGIRLIGASRQAIEVGEDRRLFKEAMGRIGLEVPRSGFARSVAEARRVLEATGLPAIIRPSFTLGGTGGGTAYNVVEFDEAVERGLDLSPTHEILVEESVLGWKEYELEVMRDNADNFVVICSIENFDPMGIHTGDSVTVAPAQTLTDREYQLMRNASRRIIREVGVETGGSNIQFAVDPKAGRMVVIEMNPRVSRSSALASKATGFRRTDLDDASIKEKLLSPDPDRIFYVKRALELGWEHAEIHRMTGIDPWFLDQIQQIADMEKQIATDMDNASLEESKRMGFSDGRIAQLMGRGTRESEVRARRLAAGIRPVYKRVDTCAAEFASHTPYLYSTYEREDESDPTNRRKDMILGSGPNRIGQGIEFD